MTPGTGLDEIAGTREATGPQIDTKAQRAVLTAGLVLVATTAFAMHPRLLVKRAYGQLTTDGPNMQFIVRFNVILAGTFLIAWLLQPLLARLCLRWNTRFTESTRRRISFATVTLISVLFACFVITFGRHQFGAFDFDILLEVGWRQILGQRPYVDFPTTSPPLFNLGIATAFRFFGVSWSGMLLFTAAFTVATLVWLYHLARANGMGRLASLAVASTAEAAAMLTCCFWWYNNSTLIFAAVFFLATFALTQQRFTVFVQSSFVVSLALLLMAKPNIAGLTIAGCVLLLLVCTRSKARVLRLSLAGVVLFFAILALAHVSIPAMLDAYRGAAKERGGFSTMGFDENSFGQKLLIEAWFVALCLPFLGIIAPVRLAFRRSDFTSVARWLFLPLAALIAIYGVRSNGEFRDVETTVLICALGLLAFVLRPTSLWLQRITAALLCAMTISDLYLGASRDRVYSVGTGLFFQWQDANNLIPQGPLKGMRVSGSFVQVNDQVVDALRHNAGPYFFGSRVDFSYMVQHVPSPEHFPAWWHPGTAFGRDKLPQILADWEQQRFPTLIYLKDDYTYYPESFLQKLRTEYVRDDGYTSITLYRRRPQS